MKLVVDEETGAFDVTFTFKAGTSQNDVGGLFTHLTLKYIYQGETSGYIDGLCIKNIYYIPNEVLPTVTPSPTPTPNPYGLSNPRIDSEGNVTWDCAYFGSYNQTAQWTKEPIKWRVLSVDENNNALIVADKNLDCKPYNETYTDVTWETSTIRSWLNGYGAGSNVERLDYSTDNFIDEAFTEEEQSAINTTVVINNDNPSYETDGGNNTEDKVYLLSIEEASNAEYGFDSTFNASSKTREVKNTDYAKYNGAYTSIHSSYAGNGEWWLRSPGSYSNDASYVFDIGWGGNDGYSVAYGRHGVRPALRINLSSSSVWIDAGVTDSEGNDGDSDGSINNPVVEDGVTTWDCIYFGSYNQTATWVKEPIKWRVLSVDGDDAFFVADKNIDCKGYNVTHRDVTWETSTLRSWINGYSADTNVEGIDYSTDNFINAAFTEEEKDAINITMVINDDNPKYGTEGGNNTEDKVYLLSIDEVSNVEYGFNSLFKEEDKAREVKNTDYAVVEGVDYSTSDEYYGNGYWWLRSPGYYESKIHVNYDGLIYEHGGDIVLYANYGVRPALHIDLSSDVWEHAGTVTSVMTDYTESTPVPTATPVPTKEPVVNQMIGVLPISANIGDIDIELSKANEALNGDSNIIEYSNDQANVSLDPIYSGLGVAYYINADKSVVDIEDYEVVINITSENEYPWLAATKSNISTNDYWDENMIQANNSYLVVYKGTRNYTFDNWSGEVQAIFVKYNTYVDEGETARTDRAEFTINSIKLVKKDGLSVNKYEISDVSEDTMIYLDNSSEYGTVSMDMAMVNSCVREYDSLYEIVSRMSARNSGTVTKYFSDESYILYSADDMTVTHVNGENEIVSDVVFTDITDGIRLELTRDDVVTTVTAYEDEPDILYINKNGEGYMVTYAKDGDDYEIVITNGWDEYISYSLDGSTYTIFATPGLVDEYDLIVKYMNVSE